jgi:hypothetical protein
VEDAAEAHVAALGRAPALGFDTFIVSAPTPFSPEDCGGLIADAPAVVARYSLTTGRSTRRWTTTNPKGWPTGGGAWAGPKVAALRRVVRRRCRWSAGDRATLDPPE